MQPDPARHHDAALRQAALIPAAMRLLVDDDGAAEKRLPVPGIDFELRRGATHHDGRGTFCLSLFSSCHQIHNSTASWMAIASSRLSPSVSSLAVRKCSAS